LAMSRWGSLPAEYSVWPDFHIGRGGRGGRGGQRGGGVASGDGGAALAPVAIGGAAFGYYANGALVWGKHAFGPGVAYDPLADKFFNPRAAKFMHGVFIGSLICIPLFLALGFVPSLMAKISERRSKKVRTKVGGAVD